MWTAVGSVLFFMSTISTESAAVCLRLLWTVVGSVLFFYVHNKQRALQSVSAYCGQSFFCHDSAYYGHFFKGNKDSTKRVSTLSRERCSLSPLIVDSRFFFTVFSYICPQ